MEIKTRNQSNKSIVEIDGYTLVLPPNTTIYSSYNLEASKYNLSKIESDIIFASTKGGYGNSTIWGITPNAKIAWKITKDSLHSEKDFLGEVRLNKRGELWIYSMAGKRYHIDLKTGQILNTIGTNLEFSFKKEELKFCDRVYKMPEKIYEVVSYKGEVLFVFTRQDNKDVSDEIDCLNAQVTAFNNRGEKLWIIGSDKPFNPLRGITISDHHARLFTTHDIIDINPYTGAVEQLHEYALGN